MPLSCSGAPFINDNVGDRRPVFDHMKQEVVDDGYDTHNFLPVFPEPEPWTFKSQFTFIETECLFDGPSADVGEEDLPGLDIGIDLAVGED